MLGVVTEAANMLRYGGYKAEPKIAEDLIAEFDRVDAEIKRLRTALRQVTNQPTMPLPDPVAHSWEAYGKRANYALRDCRNIAHAALKE